MLLQTVETKCKCHGISGSCSVRTCWKGASELATIAATLKMRYMSASKVVRRRVGSRKQFVPKDMDLRPIRKEELIYMAGSPDYCSHSAEMGSDGTQGRCETSVEEPRVGVVRGRPSPKLHHNNVQQTTLK